MGRSLSHSQEEVFAAAERLAAKGIDVTATSLRTELGDKGSFSTLRKQIEQWKEQRTEPVPVAHIEMPDSVKAAFQNCWQSVQEIAGREISEIKKQTETELAGYRQTLQESEQEIERLEAVENDQAEVLQETQAALEDCTQQLKDSQHKAEALALQLQEEKERYAALSLKFDASVAAHEQQLSALHQQHTAAISEQVRETTTLKTQLAEQLKAVDVAEAARAKAALELDKEKQDSQARVSTLMELQHTMVQKENQYKATLESFQAAKEKAKLINKQAIEEAKELSQELGLLQAEMTKLQSETATLQKQNSELHATIRSFTEQRKSDENGSKKSSKGGA